MAFPRTRTFAFRLELPDGPHIGVHRATVRGDIEKAEVRDLVIKSIKNGLAQNEDAELDENSIKDATADHGIIDKMVAQLRAENPNRPLADDLGVTKELLAKPEVARTIAAANQVQEDA